MTMDSHTIIRHSNRVLENASALMAALPSQQQQQLDNTFSSMNPASTSLPSPSSLSSSSLSSSSVSSTYDRLDYTQPDHHGDFVLVFNIFYYGLAIPVSYVGNLFTYIIVCKILKYRNSTSDVLVGGLALNDFLTAMIVFTPALISAARGRYFGDRVMCEFSAVTTVWYLYTTFAMIVLINADRWLSITKPFLYKRIHITGIKLKAVMGLQGFFCLMLASTPLIRYPAALKAGWYCAPVQVYYCHVPINISNNNNNLTASFSASSSSSSYFSPFPASSSPPFPPDATTTTAPTPAIMMSPVNSSSTFPTKKVVCGVFPVQETIYIKLVYLAVGIAMLVGCNMSIAYTLKMRPFGDAASREMDTKFARIMAVVAALFLLTWLPSVAAQATCLAKSRVCQQFEFWAMRIVNIGVAVNPVVYGVMKTTYRRGYLYLARLTLHYLTCTLLPLPAYGEEIFDLRERVAQAHTRGAAGRSSNSSSGSKQPPQRGLSIDADSVGHPRKSTLTSYLGITETNSPERAKNKYQTHSGMYQEIAERDSPHRHLSPEINYIRYDSHPGNDTHRPYQGISGTDSPDGKEITYESHPAEYQVIPDGDSPRSRSPEMKEIVHESHPGEAKELDYQGMLEREAPERRNIRHECQTWEADTSKYKGISVIHVLERNSPESRESKRFESHPEYNSREVRQVEYKELPDTDSSKGGKFKLDGLPKIHSLENKAPEAKEIKYELSLGRKELILGDILERNSLDSIEPKKRGIPEGNDQLERLNYEDRVSIQSPEREARINKGLLDSDSLERDIPKDESRSKRESLGQKTHKNNDHQRNNLARERKPIENRSEFYVENETADQSTVMYMTIPVDSRSENIDEDPDGSRQNEQIKEGDVGVADTSMVTSENIPIDSVTLSPLHCNGSQA